MVKKVLLVMVMVVALCLGLKGVVYGDPSDDKGRIKDVPPPVVVKQTMP